MSYENDYAKVGDSGETEMINSYVPSKCRSVLKSSTSWGLREAVYSDIYAYAKRLSFQRQGQFLRNTKYQKAGGSKLRGISRNQIRIGVATDKVNTVFFVEGKGKPSQKITYETFVKHIAPNSTLIHDKEAAHQKLVSAFANPKTLRYREFFAVNTRL